MTAGAVIGSDVGGTFTDLVGWDGERLVTGKVPSTPDDQSRGVVAGAARTGIDARRLLHGTTVATNALLERRGARTALVTTSGFEDVLEIGRQDRPSLYDPYADRPEPLVPPPLRAGVPREGLSGGDPGLLAVLDSAESVAICLVDGYRDPAAEQAVSRIIGAGRGGRFVSLSSEVAPEFREYERTATTVLNAYLGPTVHRYLAALVDRARDGGLPEEVAVMRSSGGLITVAEASELAAAILLSGPAAGVVAAAELGTALGRSRLVSFDMGGTSTDVCRIDDGAPETLYERPVAGFPCRLPSVAIHTVGAGGGSIGWVDPGGALRVGPMSAGAVPGPACYGLGGETPTVTDAHVVLGTIGGSSRLAGTVPIDGAAAASVTAELGARLGLAPDEAAAGVVRVVEEVMAGAIRRVSLEEGADPREATLVAFGGAGGLHAVSLARRLDMAGAVVPPHTGVFSALGLLLSPPRVDVVRGLLMTAADGPDLGAHAAAVEAEATARLGATGSRPVAVAASVDARYLGQSHELNVPCPHGSTWETISAEFHRLHERRNGFARRSDPIEIVAVRAAATGDPELRWGDIGAARPVGPARIGERRVLESGAMVEAVRWRRAGLAPGDEVVGPAVVEEDDATTYVPRASRAVVHDSGALEVEW